MRMRHISLSKVVGGVELKIVNWTLIEDRTVEGYECETLICQIL